MKYDPKSNTFHISATDMQLAFHSLLYSMRNIRKMAGLPLDKYKHDGPLTDACYAQKGILDAANHLGIEMGGEWGEEIDLRENK